MHLQIKTISFLFVFIRKIVVTLIITVEVYVLLHIEEYSMYPNKVSI